MKKIMTMSALLALAQQSGPNRRFANAGGGAGLVVANDLTYTGAADPSINIMGAVQDFSQEGHQNRKFGITISNTSGLARTARLFAGMNFGDNATAPGQMSDGAFNDTEGEPGLSASSVSTASTIKQFMRYINNNPMRVVVIRVQVSDDAQIQQEFEVRTIDVFNRQGSYTLAPSQEITSASFNPKIAMLRTDGLQLDDVTEILYSIQPNTSVTLTLYVGAILDQAQELRGKAAIAQQNLSFTR